MKKIMEWLYASLSFVEHRWFKKLVTLVIFFNPIALIPQTIAVFSAPSVQGISVSMWIMFLLIQLALVFNGIRLKDGTVAFSMLISAVQSIVIIVTVLIRS